MAWERWEGWEKGDPRWSHHIIDTDDLSAEQAVREVERWVRSMLDGGSP